jgi:hypothetical protein
MFSLEDQLTRLYVFVDDFCQARPDTELQSNDDRLYCG